MLVLTITLSLPLAETVGAQSLMSGAQLYSQRRGVAESHLVGSGLFTCPTIPGADQSGCSTNWSGYAVLGAAGTFDRAFGSWVVPSVACPPSGQTFVALWVGIDGFNSATVEQTGVLAECIGGSPTYAVWYEFYPAPMVAIGSVAVSPGDVVTATISYDSATDKFTTYVESSGGGSYTKTQAVSGADRSSAEWIVERPSLCFGGNCVLTTLSDFGNSSLGVDYTGSNGTNYARAGNTTGTIAEFSNAGISMVAGASGPLLAKPTALTADGTSFRVDFARTPPPPPPAPNPSSIAVACSKQIMVVGSRANCRATITGNSPTGTVTWTSSADSKFSSTTCRLVRSTCFVRFTPKLAGGNNSITGSYHGDRNNSPLAGNFLLTVTQKPSKVRSGCIPTIGSVSHLTTFKCLATVGGYWPTGTVSWSQNGTGSVSFASTSCTLVKSKCFVLMTAAGIGKVAILALYTGDTNNFNSNATRVLTIKP